MGCIFSRFFSSQEIVYSRELQLILPVTKNDIYHNNKLEIDMDYKETNNREINNKQKEQKVMRIIKHI